MAKKTKLPDRPSALIRLALADLRAVEQLKSYEVDMGCYHLGQEKEIERDKCLVCFAGAVMARTLEVPKTRDADPDRFDRDTQDKLYALDHFRRGMIELAFDDMGIDLDDKWIPRSVAVAHYSHDKKQFKKDMADMADVLESRGL